MTEGGVNAALDRLPRTRVARAAREAPAFRACGVTGFYGALLALVAGGLLAGRSLLVLAVVAVVSAASFFVWAFARRAVTGREELVLLEHVWFAEACVAGSLAAIGEPVLPYLDVLAVALCVFLAGGRIGCLLAGCCFGRPSSLGIRYGPEAADDGFPRHLVGVRLLPVPAFEAAGLLAIGAAGLAALPHAHAGAVFTFFLASYAVLRFGLEALRGDRRPHVLGLSVNRWMCVTELAVALTIDAWPIGAHDTAIAAFLAVTLVACVAGRRALDVRGRLLTPAHVAELQQVVADLEPRAKTEPLTATTRGGVAVAVSRDDALHVSLSLPGRPRDLPLLCALAAHVVPRIDATSIGVTGPVLHVREGTVATPGEELYGHVVRTIQAQVLRSAERSAYFPPRRAA